MSNQSSFRKLPSQCTEDPRARTNLDARSLEDSSETEIDHTSKVNRKSKRIKSRGLSKSRPSSRSKSRGSKGHRSKRHRKFASSPVKKQEPASIAVYQPDLTNQPKNTFSVTSFGKVPAA